MSKAYIPKELRKRVAKRANNLCEYCLFSALFAPSRFWIDHILHESGGGLTVFENLAYTCPHCNNTKLQKTHGKDSFTNKVVPLFNSRKQQWKEHFQFNSDYTVIIGITACGRATVETLKMNLPFRVNLRKALISYGVYPPERY